MDYDFLKPVKRNRQDDGEVTSSSFLDPVQRNAPQRNTFSEVQRIRNLPTISDTKLSFNPLAVAMVAPLKINHTTKPVLESYQTALSPMESTRLTQLQKANSQLLLKNPKEQQELNDLLAKQKRTQEEAARQKSQEIRPFTVGAENDSLIRNTNDKLKEFAYGLGGAVGGNLAGKAWEDTLKYSNGGKLPNGYSNVGDTENDMAQNVTDWKQAGATDKDIEELRKIALAQAKEKDNLKQLQYNLGKNPNWTPETADKIASGAGEFTGDLIKMFGIGGAANLASKGIQNPFLQKIAERTLTGVGLGADETYENGGNVQDLLSNVGRQALFMNAGGAASDLVGKTGLKALNKFGLNNKAANVGLSTLKGAAFGSAGTASTLPTYSSSERPGMKELGKQALMGAAFEGIPGILNSLKGNFPVLQNTTATTPATTTPVSNLLEPSQKFVTGESNNKTSFKDKAEKAYMRLVDVNKPIQNKINNSTFVTATNSKNSGNVVSHIANEALVDNAGQKIGSSLKELIGSNLPKGQETDFWEYALQRHNVERSADDKPVFFHNSNGKEIPYTQKESATRIAEIEKSHPEWKQKADNITNWIDTFMKQWGVNEGVVDSKLYSELRKKYPNYIPTNRGFSDLEDFLTAGSGNGRSFVDQPVPVKKAQGSQRNIVDPTENIMNLVNRTVRTAKYNRVGQELVKAIQTNPTNAYAEIVPKDIPNVDNVVSVLVDGKPVYVKINDANLLASLKSVYNVNIGDIEKVAKSITNKYKALITTKNPVFAIRNIARDLPTYLVNSKENNPLKLFGNLGKAFKDIATNSGTYQQYKALGGEGSNFFNPGRPTKSVSEITQRVPIVKNGVITGYRNVNPVKRAFNAVGNKVEKFNNIIETAPRLAEFRNSVGKGNNLQQAVFDAADVTTNFSRGGDLTKKADSVVPYLNAGIQGLDKLARQFRHKPIPTTIKGLIGITSASLVLDQINKDNPDYQQLDNRTKDNYFVIPKGDGTFIKIPKSRELGVLFGGLFERALRATRGDEEAFKDFRNTVATNFSPTNPLENNLLAPFAINLPKNKDFANRTIVPQSMQDRSAKYQYDETTSDIGKKIGELTSMSPKQVDYLIKSYTGVVGQLGLPATTNKNYQTGNTFDKLVKPITTQFIADPAYSNQNITNFYDNKDSLAKQYADFKFTDNSVKPPYWTEAEWKKWKPTMEKQLVYELYNDASDAITTLKKEINNVEVNSKFSNDEKQKTTKDLLNKINYIATRSNKLYKSSDKRDIGDFNKELDDLLKQYKKGK